MASTMEIRCKACGRLSLARAEPVYEDFKKVAETFVCSACGHRYPSREATPFVDADGRPRVFSDADKPVAVKVFKADERRRSCAWCRHYIVNPFYQRCGLNNRAVEATDVCARFSAKPDQPAETGKSKGSDANSRFDALFGKETPPAATAASEAKEEPAKTAPGAAQADRAPQEAPVEKTAGKPARRPARKPRKQSAK